ncbi:MAG: MoxR family ATPase [Lachnospiraceae bacterium]|nr:MoxR family ATPase [Lachnospiraceae bacterium]
MDTKTTLSGIALLGSNIEKRIVGKREIIDRLIIALLSGGHVLIEDVPGVGKTSLARALADSLSLSFARIQCTPDTMPGDITGVSVYNSKTGQFEVVPGPVMNNIVLADELNRTSPKTQSALLEAMEEHSVTIDGKNMPLPEPFMVIGTQNPMETAGCYPLPEAQLDRFMMKLSVGYPKKEDAVRMATGFLEGTLHEATEAVLTGQDILGMRSVVAGITVSDKLTDLAVSIVEATRSDADISCGASPRALLALLRCAQAYAHLAGRDYCIPEDIINAASLTLPHRLVLTAQAKMNRMSQEQVLRRITDHIKVPS